MEKSKSNHKIPEITVTSDTILEDDVETNLLKVQSEASFKKDSFESCYLEVPVRSLPSRQSIVSRQSIEAFLSTFPRNEAEFTNREIISTVQEIMSSEIGIRDKMSCVEKTRLILESHQFHMFTIGLVIIDIICVILQVVLDIISKDFNDHILHLIEEAAEILSAFVLSLFLVSIFFHIVFLPKLFFKSKLEMFDALIVILSFCFEILSIIKKDSVRAIEAAVITFRFWRIIRIVNAIVITVEKRVYEKLDNLKNDIKNVLDENKIMESELSKKETECKSLKTQIDEKNKELTEVQAKFHNFITENQKMRLKERIRSDSLKLDLKKYEIKIIDLEKKLKELTNKNQVENSVDT